MTASDIDKARTPTDLESTIRSRCRALSLPCWVIDESSQVVERPDDVGSARAFLHSEQLESMVATCFEVHRPSMRQLCAHVELMEGASLIILPVRDQRRASVYVVALTLTHDSIRTTRFQSLIEEAHLDSRAIQADLQERFCVVPARAMRVAQILSWTIEDLTETSALRRDTEELGRQLSESYEEIALLYKLREGISAETKPARFVDEACRDLLDVIPFKWVGVTFSRDRREARSLAGESMLFGTAPTDESHFRYIMDGIAHEMDPEQPRIVEGEDCAELSRDGSPIVVIPFGKHGSTYGMIAAGSKTNSESAITSIEMKLIEAVAGHILVLIENAGLYEEQRDTFLGTLQALTTAIDAKDRYTCGHSERVAHVSELIAKAIGLSSEMTERIRISGLVHDVGKIGVPESVLRKPGKLTQDEFDQIKLHPQIGHAILRDIPQLEDVLPGVLYHHERYDGNGYPFGLQGEDIPLMARVIGLADAFDAMSSSRTYRSAMDRAKVLREIRDCAGKQFDPELAERFTTIDLSTYEDMVRRHQELADASGQGRAA